MSQEGKVHQRRRSLASVGLTSLHALSQEPFCPRPSDLVSALSSVRLASPQLWGSNRPLPLRCPCCKVANITGRQLQKLYERKRNEIIPILPFKHLIAHIYIQYINSIMSVDEQTDSLLQEGIIGEGSHTRGSRLFTT